MRFDEFVRETEIVVTPVERFAGFRVEVGIPAGWEPFDADVGVRIWACSNDPCIETFCANAVLTMHRVESALDPGETFAMLAEQQLQSVPGAHEVGREIAEATEGAGVTSLLAMQIADVLGTIDSVSRSRIIRTEEETMIAQLTVTALHDSPVDRTQVWLTVQPATVTGLAPVGSHGGGDFEERR